MIKIGLVSSAQWVFSEERDITCPVTVSMKVNFVLFKVLSRIHWKKLNPVFRRKRNVAAETHDVLNRQNSRSPLATIENPLCQEFETTKL